MSMYICITLCTSMYLYRSAYEYIFIYECLHMHMSVFTYMCMSVYLCRCEDVHLCNMYHIYLYVPTAIPVCLHFYGCLYIGVYKCV